MRPNGVADAQTVEIPSPPKELSTGTHLKSQSRVLVPVEIEGVFGKQLLGPILCGSLS